MNGKNTDTDSAVESQAPAGPPPPQPARTRTYADFGSFLLQMAMTNIVLVVLSCAYIAAFGGPGDWGLFAVVPFICVAQVVLGVIALLLRGARLQGLFSILSSPAILLLGWLAIRAVGGGSGMGWGRPLRVRGRQLYPQLRHGADWTHGDKPDSAQIDIATRRALEALWLHDAQKEHASVPAFARISWMLAAVGAPADLVAWSHRAALQEVAHAQKCFALAAGYGGRSHSVEPMPDLLLHGLQVGGDPIAVLARESLEDGCQLEEFNADVAAACAAVCEEPVVRRVQEQIARDERSHAEFSWALLEWTLRSHPETVRPEIAQAASRLHAMERPRAAGTNLLPLLERADAAQLRRHGRIDDGEVAQLWKRRIVLTRERLDAMLALTADTAPAASSSRTSPSMFAESLR